MQWYYSKNNTQLGPVSAAELVAKLASGEVSAADLVWREGMLDWMPAGQVAELRGLIVPSGYPSAPTASAGSGSPYAPPSAAVAADGGADIPTYLWQAIVATLICCQPLGIPAIVFAAKADAFKASGNQAEAKVASDKARTWCWIAFGVGLSINLLVGVLAASGAMNSSSLR